MAISAFTRKKTFVFLGIAAIAMIALIALIAAFAFSVEHLAFGTQTKSFTLDVEFDKVRQIMVRKNGAESIIANSGMKLLEQSLQDIQLDTSRDDRPVINAILGKTKTDLSAIKHLKVRLDDPSLEAEELLLRQAAEIDPEEIKVVTESREAAGRLEKYKTTLHALPNGNKTEITLSVELNIRVKVPRLFVRRADQRVQQAAIKAVENQERAMTKFIKEHADQRLILPDFWP